MKSTAEDLPIGDLAARFGLATHVLRHWESEGLLTPQRLPNGRRRYGHADLVRVALILRGKEAGLSLEDLRAVLQADDGAQRREVMLRHRAELLERIQRLETARTLMEHALTCTEPDILECPHFQAYVTAAIPGS